MFRRNIALAIFLGTLAAAPMTEARPTPSRATVHEVTRGQVLSEIAKRYGITVEARCEENGIRKSSVIRVGQRLVLP